jgi:hypothetical protein
LEVVVLGLVTYTDVNVDVGKADSEAVICLAGALIRECENFLDVGNSKMTEQCIL